MIALYSIILTPWRWVSWIEAWSGFVVKEAFDHYLGLYLRQVHEDWGISGWWVQMVLKIWILTTIQTKTDVYVGSRIQCKKRKVEKRIKKNRQVGFFSVDSNALFWGMLQQTWINQWHHIRVSTGGLNSHVLSFYEIGFSCQ